MRRAFAAAAFVVLCVYAAIRWGALVVDPPHARIALAVALASVAGYALASPRLLELGPLPRTGARVAIAVPALAGGWIALGIPAELLLPSGWDRLVAGVDSGLTGLRLQEWPYGGPSEWVRRSILALAVPVALCASALASWPAPPRLESWMRGLALLLVAGLFGVGAANVAPAAPAPAGALLLALIAAWWLAPRLPAPGLPAMAMLTVGAAVAVPAAAYAPAGEPLVDYRSLWRTGGGSSFDWDHAYGPIDWPRSGEVMLEVRASRPRYWKTATLGEFDGYGWTEAPRSAGTDPALPEDPPKRWRTSARITVDELESTRLVTPGSPLSVSGLAGTVVTDDGTARSTVPLPAGKSYTVRAYAPDPDAARLQAAPPPASDPAASRHLGLEIPTGGDLQASTADGVARVQPAPFGAVRRERTEPLLRWSAYSGVYKLARRLTKNAPTAFDAAARVEQYLRTSYRYSESPPERPNPLRSFLLRDRIGYCQQFSGAMALMLRMVGVPARVAAGFGAGERISAHAFAIRDIDAHSWVEVRFSGVGWVPFDPTPHTAPAVDRSGSDAAPAHRASRDPITQPRSFPSLDSESPALETPELAADPRIGSAARGEEEAGALGPAALAGLGTGVALLLALALLPRLTPSRDELTELRRAVTELSPAALGAASTLTEMERMLATSGREAAAGYVAALRARRYAPRPPAAADRRGRAELRRLLGAEAGGLGRLRAWRLLPPRAKRGRGTDPGADCATVP